MTAGLSCPLIYRVRVRNWRATNQIQSLTLPWTQKIINTKTLHNDLFAIVTNLYQHFNNTKNGTN